MGTGVTQLYLTKAQSLTEDRPSAQQKKTFFQNFSSQQRVVPFDATYASITKLEKGKACLIGDSHLRRINESKFT